MWNTQFKTIQGDFLGIVPHQFERYVFHIANSAIIVQLISPIFIVITYYCVFILESDFNTKLPRNIIKSLFCISGATPNTRKIWGSSWLLRARLVYCWNSTGTKVTKFSLLSYPFRLWMITSPQSMAFTETWSKISHQEAPVFCYPN